MYVKEGINDLKTKNPELLKEWDYDKNTILPSQVSPKSGKMIWWKCENGHSWKNSPLNRTKHESNKCPYCSNQKILRGFNDFATLYPDLLKEWDYEKNIIKTTEISSRSGNSVWWKCKNGHSWKSIIVNRTKNGKRGCPICSNRILLKGYNDLATTNPELLKEWDYEKNTIKPTEIIAGTTKKA